MDVPEFDYKAPPNYQILRNKFKSKIKISLKIYRKYMVGKKACNHFYFYLMSQIKIKNISLPTFYSAPSQLEGFSVNLAFLQ